MTSHVSQKRGACHGLVVPSEAARGPAGGLASGPAGLGSSWTPAKGQSLSRVGPDTELGQASSASLAGVNYRPCLAHRTVRALFLTPNSRRGAQCPHRVG